MLGIFKIVLHLRDWHSFMWQSLNILNNFNTSLWNKFSEKRLFKKLEYHFLVESTKIDNITFPYKTALSEANIKTYRMGNKKWTYPKEESFASTFLSRKFCFNLGISCIELIWCNNHPNVHIHTFLKRWSFTFGCFFPCEYPQNRFECSWNKDCSRLCMHQKLIWMEVHIY